MSRNDARFPNEAKDMDVIGSRSLWSVPVHRSGRQRAAAVAGGFMAALILLPTPSGPASSGANTQPASFLGFDVGEERRYILGPPAALGQSESGTWLIRLAGVSGSQGGAQGLFFLEHTWRIPVLSRPIPQRTITEVESFGSIRVNAHGFPLLIEITTKRQLAGLGEEAYSASFEFEDGEYRKVVTDTWESHSEDVRIRKNRHVDLALPAGLFAYLPGPPGCFLEQPRSKPADNADCEESLFANPGLLGLAIPALWEAGGEREFVFFTPIGPIGDYSWKIGAGLAPAGGSAGGTRPLDSGRLMYEPLTPFSYHEIEELRYGDRTAIRLGRRNQEAWMIRGPGQLLAIYVDDEGRVLRVDLPKRDDSDPGRWIRMLLPSEF